jgi:hypothetical protein
VNRLLLGAPTVSWSAIERCLALLVLATLLVATVSSTLAAEGRVLTIQGRVRVLAPTVSAASANAVFSANSPRPGLGGDTATHLGSLRQLQQGFALQTPKPE